MELPIPRISDGLILSKFERIAEKLAQTNWRAQASGEQNQLFDITVKKGIASPWGQDPVAKAMSLGSGTVTQNLNLYIDGIQVANITRQGNQARDLLKVRQEWFSSNHLKYTEIGDAISFEFHVARRGQSAEISDDLAEFVESRDQGLARLEELYTRLTRALVEDRERAEKELAERKRHLAEEEDRLRKDLVEERNTLAQATATERDALARRLKEVDDRAATVARREIRKNLKEEFKNRQKEFGVTLDTQAKRKPVAVAVLTLTTVLGVGFIFYAVEFVIRPPSDPTALYLVIARQILFGLGFGGAIWYFIHWQNAWFQRHADEEFKLKRLELDFDRASWVVELAMEWSKEKSGHDIPESVLRELTRNLFTENGSAFVHQKQDVFSALLDASTKAEIAVGDTKFALNRDGAKKLKEALSEDA